MSASDYYLLISFMWLIIGSIAARFIGSAMSYIKNKETQFSRLYKLISLGYFSIVTLIIFSVILLLIVFLSLEFAYCFFIIVNIALILIVLIELQELRIENNSSDPANNSDE